MEREHAELLTDLIAWLFQFFGIDIIIIKVINFSFEVGSYFAEARVLGLVFYVFADGYDVLTSSRHQLLLSRHQIRLTVLLGHEAHVIAYVDALLYPLDSASNCTDFSSAIWTQW